MEITYSDKIEDVVTVLMCQTDDPESDTRAIQLRRACVSSMKAITTKKDFQNAQQGDIASLPNVTEEQNANLRLIRIDGDFQCRSEMTDF